MSCVTQELGKGEISSGLLRIVSRYSTGRARINSRETREMTKEMGE